MLKKIIRISIGILLILSIFLIGFILWALTPSGPMPEAMLVMRSTSELSVESTQWIVFRPLNQPIETGLILYPGGRVDPLSYAPTAAAIAEQGYLVVITPMPFNLAVFDPNQALDVMRAFPEIQFWAVGGHSLGGAMAANFTRNNLEFVDGLVLWASYPAQNDDLSTFELSVASIFATLDGLSSPEKIAASRQLLPANTIWTAIKGGNHAQFGWYGDQRGDNLALIDRHKQQDAIIEATVAFLKYITDKE